MEEKSPDSVGEVLRLLSNYQNVLVDRQFKELVAAHGLLKPFDEKLLSGCAYDLRVGNILRSRNRLASFDLGRAEYVVESGECVTIDTLEEIDFRSRLLFGYVVNKHTILAKGFFHPATTVDAGFKGPLALTFINLGNVRFTLRRGEPVAKLVLVPVAPAPERIYGVTQRPSYREGSTDIALIVDNPEHRTDDSELANMYGLPVKRLYDHIQALRQSSELYELRREEQRRAGRRQIFWNILFAMIGGVMGTVTTIYWKEITGVVGALFVLR
jgi:deoxycytidine triphosphate deaminase